LPGCENSPQEKTIIAKVHSSQWVNHIASTHYFNAKMKNVSNDVQIEGLEETQTKMASSNPPTVFARPETCDISK
jgi:hypothetical protein